MHIEQNQHNIRKELHTRNFVYFLFVTLLLASLSVSAFASVMAEPCDLQRRTVTDIYICDNCSCSFENFL